MSQKLKSTAPWLILPAIVIAIAILGILPPSQSVRAEESGSNEDVSQSDDPNNPKPEKCCACFEEDFAITYSDSSGGSNKAEKASDVDCYSIPKDDDRLKFTVTVTKVNPLPEGCDNAVPTVKVYDENDQIVSIKVGFVTNHDFKKDPDMEKYRIEVWCSNSKVSDDGPCSTKCITCGCGCEDGMCDTGVCDPDTASGSVHIGFSLGSARQGDDAGLKLKYHSDTITNLGVSALNLWAPNNGSVITTRDGQGHITTVKTGNINAAVVSTPTSTDPNAFEIRKSADLTNPVTVANAFRTTRVENTAADKLLVTTSFNGATKKTEYTYVQASNTWIRVEGITASVPNGLLKEDLTISDDGASRTEHRKIIDVPSDDITSDVVTTYTYFPWGREMTKRVIDPTGAALTTTWDYYEPGEQTGLNGGIIGYGRLQTMTRYDGYEETHLYDLNQRTIFRPFAGQGGALVERRLYHPQTKTLTVTRQVGSNILSKTVTIEQSDTVTVEQGYTDANNFLETTTEYYPSGQDFGGQVKKVHHPDGTVTIHEYSRNGGLKTTTSYNGVPGGTNITEGTQTITVINQSGQTISSITIAVGTGGGTTLSHSLATAEDDYGRPTAMGYFPYTDDGGTPGDPSDDTSGYAYTTSRTFGCCGVVTDTDRTGITTHYAFDALRRQIKTNRLGVTTETRPLGLTTSTYRYPETGSAAEVGNPAGTAATEVGRSVRLLSGTRSEQWSRTAKDGTLVKAVETDVTYLNPAHTTPATLPAGIGMVSVTKAIQTADDAAQPTQTTETYLDGKTYQTYGALSPAMRYAYTAGATGMESTRSYVDAGNLRESVTTKADLAGRTTATVYADNSTATASYNALGQMDKSIDPDGVTTFYEYNPEGQRELTILDLNGNGAKDPGTDQYTLTVTNPGTYGGSDVITTENIVFQGNATYPNGGTVVSRSHRAVTGLRSWGTSFPLLANPDERTSESISTLLGSGSTTSTSIAPDNSYTVQTTTSGLAAKTESFDAVNTLIASTTYTTYDSHNRPTHVTDSRTGTSVTVYVNAVTDAVASVTDAAGHSTAFTYDVRSRRVTVDAPDTLDADGLTLANINTTHYLAHGQVKETVGGQVYRRTHTYDYAHRQKTLTTYGTTTATTEWVYDTSRGFLTEKNYHGETGNGPGNTADYTYTAAGRLATRTWERGVTTTYHFDAAGRQDKTTYSDGTQQVDYILDRLSRPRFAIQGTQLTGSTVHVTEYTYRTDNLTLDTEIAAEGPYDSNATTTQYTSSYAFKRTLDRSVDGMLRPTGWTLDATEHSAAYSYRTNDSRLDTVTGSSQSHTYAYLANSYGLVSTVTSPAHTVTNTYEANRNILTKKENKNGGTNLATVDYTSNGIGQRNTAAHGGSNNNGASSRTFGYNASGEVISTATNSTAFDRYFNFDGIGNRNESRTGTSTGTGGTAISYTPDAQNFYTAIDSLTPVKDADGNMTSGPLPVAPSVNSTLAWDAENRLISVTVSGTTTTYGYDFQHRRISKTTGAAVTRFVYDGWNMITEYAGTTLKRSYTWGMDLSGSMQGAGGVGGLLSIHEASGNGSAKAGQTLYPVFDGNGNITRIIDSSSNVVCSYGYDPFGNFENPTGNDADSSGYAAEQPFGFSTKYLDVESGLYYYGYRWYDPKTGRWISRDPIEENGGFNLYEFVSNNVVNRHDHFGLWSPKAHDVLQQSSFAGFLEPWVISQMKSDGRLFDRSTQSGAESFKHAMAEGVLLPPIISSLPFPINVGIVSKLPLATEKASTNKFIDSKLTSSQRLAKRATTLTAIGRMWASRAVKEFAEAMHPVMDRSSPAHTDAAGMPKLWHILHSSALNHSPNEFMGFETARHLTPAILTSQKRLMNQHWRSRFKGIDYLCFRVITQLKP